MTATQHPTPISDSLLRHEELIQMYDGAMNHLARARYSGPVDQKQSISSVVTILNHLIEAYERAQVQEDDGADLPDLYAYMIDRLSISHSGLGIDPINEVNWLIRNLRELSSAPTRQIPANG